MRTSRGNRCCYTGGRGVAFCPRRSLTHSVVGLTRRSDPCVQQLKYSFTSLRVTPCSCSMSLQRSATVIEILSLASCHIRRGRVCLAEKS